MNRQPDVELVLREYFADDGSIAPDYVLDVIEARIGRQRRRPARRLFGRDLHVITTSKLVAVLAAVLVISVIGIALVLRPGSNVGSGGPTAAPSPSAVPTPSASLASQVAIVDPAEAGSNMPAALLGRYTEGATPSGEVGYMWELLSAGDARCSQLVHLTTSCIVITRQPADVEQYGPAAVHGDLLYYRMITHNFNTDPCLNKIIVWRFRILADRVTMEQLDPGCRNSLDDAGFLLALKP